MTFFKWSRIAADNGTADSTCPAPEGWSPAQVNNTYRGGMAALAKYRDDMSGQIVTGGTSTAYTATSFQGFISLLAMHGKTIFFTPHVTNGANGTSLNVDGLGVKPILTAPGVGLPGGVLIAGTPYGVVYNDTDGAFYIHGLFGNPNNIPIGGSIDYWGAAAPNSNFALAYGQAISRTTYAALFALLGTTYGGGDGSTTFNIPDLRGRVVAGKDDMGGSAAGRLTTSYFGATATVLGTPGGSESTTLTAAQIPTITGAQANNVAISTTSVEYTTRGTNAVTTGSAQGGGPIAGQFISEGAGVGKLTATGTIAAGAMTFQSNNTSGNAHRTVQPTIIANKLLRII